LRIHVERSNVTLNLRHYLDTKKVVNHANEEPTEALIRWPA
jgi:hypothetical protein